MKEKKHIALQIACGEITDTKFDENNNFVITTYENYLINLLEQKGNREILEEALRWLGLNCKLVVVKKRKLSEIQAEDIKKLKALGLEIKVIEGDN